MMKCPGCGKAMEFDPTKIKVKIINDELVGKTVLMDFGCDTYGGQAGITIPRQRSAHIEYFGVVPRRKGLGRNLYRYVENYLKSTGVSEITLEPTDEDAYNFWRSMGYKFKEKDRMIMVKRL